MTDAIFSVEMRDTVNATKPCAFCLSTNRNSSRGAVFIMGEYGQELKYDAWVCFYLCEEALGAEEFTGRDIKYCFESIDEAGMRQIGGNEFQTDMPHPASSAISAHYLMPRSVHSSGPPHIG